MKVVAFGEFMLRLSPEGYLRFLQEPRFQASFGGCDANALVSLSQFGQETSFVSALPDNPIGDAAICELRRYGVNTEFVVRGGSRMGIYYLEKGAAQRSGRVVYDRKGSSFAETRAEQYRFADAFRNADWFHCSGITPALSLEAKEGMCLALKEAKRQGLTVSCDINFRRNLWTAEQAGETMRGFMHDVDVCIVNEEHARLVLGIEGTKKLTENGCPNQEGYAEIAKQLVERFGFRSVALTIRSGSSAFDNNFSAMLFQDGKAEFSTIYSMHMVDRVGGGDSFSAALIYAMGMKMNQKQAVEFAAAAACLKHSVEGDFNRVTLEEVLQLMRGGIIGQVQR